ncbi:TPA: dUTP diphosphatase [Candidatus Dojkabacteria bacterium]|uniref:dUTP diphosphatase n=1 Tax=Candidatus Dojkabacteria bacterium TaxID=2099670 RepID=A0A832RC88_9BACT|nr:dUTP diphosphatase [Candidatus Dojkabacteria bacterium]
MKRRMKIKVDNQKYLPEVKTEFSAGADLKVKTEKDIVVKPNESAEIHTGVYLEIPKGYVGLLFVRSSFGKKGLMLKNSVGVIDSDYRGEVIAQVINTSKSGIVLTDTERFAQIVVVPCLSLKDNLEVADELEETERGEGGFGSTGK